VRKEEAIDCFQEKEEWWIIVKHHLSVKKNNLISKDRMNVLLDEHCR
jgi:hypothetical protein